VVRFNDAYHVCFKVETHNRPSAIEPYGGSSTGIGGVIRDPLGTGLGAKPICNTDVFCFAPPDTPPESLPPGVLHPRKVMKGVVAGVRDYGNRMGIPTVNGAVCFDERYLANPLVYCGTVGLIPVERSRKAAVAGDLIVAAGGRTGRDGIHGATFSSAGLTAESEQVSGGAVQIGNAIAEKKLLDVLLQSRDRGLYHAITDCGAGGFSSAVGEMGEHLGAHVDLEQAPLKYAGLSYTEIWISEAQERMILAVPADKWEELRALCAAEDVEAAVLGRFEATGRLKLFYDKHEVADLSMDFLHNGRPAVVRQASWAAPALPEPALPKGEDFNRTLVQILGSLNVCSKEWIIRQYDHEVQGGSVLKPLVGTADDGPGDAAVIMPVLGEWAGLAVGCGLQPRLGDLDPYAMAAAAIDEAVRNVVAVGADPARVAILDNFCWGNTDRPEVLGSLVRAAEACRDVALAYGTPFISGKDSLKNEYHSGGRHLVIPPTLLISALGRVPDVRRCVSMDLKEPGNVLYLLGATGPELGGSHYHLVHGLQVGVVPKVDLQLAPRLFARLHQAITHGLVRSCHDLSEGGLAVAVAEMAFAGGVGADLTGLTGMGLADAPLLFAESPTRFILEVRPGQTAALEECLGPDVPWRKLGQTIREPRLRIAGGSGEWVVWAGLDQLKEAWQKPLRW
jgi:phosphoribosylformylglycinamidine synthase